MLVQLVEKVKKEEPLLRWLHGRDAARPLDEQLLSSSVTMRDLIKLTSTTKASSTESPANIPELSTVSLMVPMYRRKQFVLGQIYGVESANSALLSTLSSNGWATSLGTFSCRRFVVDVLARNLEMLEYGWSQDDQLCATIHHVDHNGMYKSHTIFLESISKWRVFLQNGPAFTETDQSHHNQLDNVNMRLTMSELETCHACARDGTLCKCANTRECVQSRLDVVDNWNAWTRAFIQSREKLEVCHFSASFCSTSMRSPRTVTVCAKQSFQRGGNLFFCHYLPMFDALFSTGGTRRGCIPLPVVESNAQDSDTVKNTAVESVCQTGLDGHIMSGVSGDEENNEIGRDDWSSSECMSRCSSLANERNDTRPNFNRRCIEDNGVGNNKSSSATCSSSSWSSSYGLRVRGPRTKRRGKSKCHVIICDCGKRFDHRGHYNEHRLCVHDRVRHHQCAYLHCRR